MAVLPTFVMLAVTTAVGLLIGRGIYMLLSGAAMAVTAVFSGLKYFNDQRDARKKRKEREKKYLSYLWKRQREMAEARIQEQGIYASRYPGITEIYEMIR